MLNRALVSCSHHTIVIRYIMIKYALSLSILQTTTYSRWTTKINYSTNSQIEFISVVTMETCHLTVLSFIPLTLYYSPSNSVDGHNVDGLTARLGIWSHLCGWHQCWGHTVGPKAYHVRLWTDWFAALWLSQLLAKHATSKTTSLENMVRESNTNRQVRQIRCNGVQD